MLHQRSVLLASVLSIILVGCGGSGGGGGGSDPGGTTGGTGTGGGTTGGTGGGSGTGGEDPPSSTEPFTVTSVVLSGNTDKPALVTSDIALDSDSATTLFSFDLGPLSSTAMDTELTATNEISGDSVSLVIGVALE